MTEKKHEMRDRRIQRDLNKLSQNVGLVEHIKKGEIRSTGKNIILERKYEIKVIEQNM